MRKKEKEDGDDLREEAWEAVNDLALAQLHGGQNVSELAAMFERTEEFIESRLKKLKEQAGQGVHRQQPTVLQEPATS